MSDETTSWGALEQPIYPGLMAGRVGVVAARAGVGKSSCLARIALDELVRGGQVLHVALDNPVDHVRVSYDAKLDALQEQDREKLPLSARLELERRRLIHSYLGGSFSPGKLGDALGFLSEHMDFRPSSVIVDGLSFSEATLPEVRSLAQIAGKVDASLWMSALARREDSEDEGTGLPSPLVPFDDLLEVVICLEPRGEEILVFALKEGAARDRRRLPVRLDPATMLLVHDETVLEDE